jgi:hypothetical protein
MIVVRSLLAGLGVGAAGSLEAQGLMASGEISSALVSPGVYQYTLTISDASSATLSIASFWYAWTPGSFYLPGVPTSAGGPADWTAHVFSDSIQFSANSAGADIAPGGSLTFTYQATFTPQALSLAPNSGLSVAYAGALQSTPNEDFTVAAVPEPSTAGLVLVGLVGFGLAGWRRRAGRGAS